MSEEPVDSDEGYAEMRSTWENGTLTETSFWHADGTPAGNTDGAHRIIYVEDGRKLNPPRMIDLSGTDMSDN